MSLTIPTDPVVRFAEGHSPMFREQAEVEHRPLRAATHPGCFVCGAANSKGLHIQFRVDAPGRVHALWTPSSDWEGFRGIVHGGLVSTVLDEAMSKAVASLPCEALTAELRVRFRKPVRSGVPLQITGWVSQQRKRRVATEALMVASDGEEYAHAWAIFLDLVR